MRVVALALAGGASSARAQARTVAGAVDGIVTDTGAAPLGEATVSILSSGVRVVTGASGRFRIVDLPAGTYIVMVRRLGYLSTSTVMQVADGDTLRSSFALARVAPLLDTVEVIASTCGDLLRPILSVSIRDGTAGQWAFSMRGGKGFCRSRAHSR